WITRILSSWAPPTYYYTASRLPLCIACQPGRAGGGVPGQAHVKGAVVIGDVPGHAVLDDCRVVVLEPGLRHAKRQEEGAPGVLRERAPAGAFQDVRAVRPR